MSTLETTTLSPQDRRDHDGDEITKLQALCERVENLFANSQQQALLGMRENHENSSPLFALNQPQPVDGLPEDFPRFARAELTTGLCLGQGCFSQVFEIKRIQTTTRRHSDQENQAARAFVSSRCLTSYGETRFALKTPRQDILDDPYQAWMNYANMVVETRLLSQLDHPHIIKLRAIAESTVPLSPGYFIIVDRFYDTLRMRIKKWKTETDVRNKTNKKRTWRLLSQFRQRDDKESDATNLLWKERMTHALHLSSAIAYMHEQRVIHRDIKPENIGFSVHDEIKIFDLGISRPIVSTAKVYHMSMAGSPRYMAPEVANGEPYNQACDVYSLTLLVWEMLSLKRPYHCARSLEDLQNKVCRKACRPRIPKHWSRSLQETLKAGWEQDQFERISMEMLHSRLS